MRGRLDRKLEILGELVSELEARERGRGNGKRIFTVP